MQLLRFYRIDNDGHQSPHSELSDKNSTSGESLFTLFDEAKKGALHNLSNDECITNFGQTYQEKYSKLLLVTNDPRSKRFILPFTHQCRIQEY